MFSNRRPYYGLKLSISDLFREPVRYLKQSNTQESMMEKPYLIDEYPKMHLSVPDFKYKPRKRTGFFGPIASVMPDRGIAMVDWGDAYCKWDITNTGRCIKEPIIITLFAEHFWSSEFKFTASISVDSIGVGIAQLAETEAHAWDEQNYQLTFPENARGSVTICGYASTYTLTSQTFETVVAGMPVGLRIIGGAIAMVESGQSEPATLLRSSYGYKGDSCGCITIESSCDDPCGSASIGYTSQQMQTDEVQSLTINDGGAGCNYSWSITSGGGSMDGSDYTAPTTNAECADNPTISLMVNGSVVDTLEIAVNAAGGGVLAYKSCSETAMAEYSPPCYYGSEPTYVLCYMFYDCNGAALAEGGNNAECCSSLLWTTDPDGCSGIGYGIGTTDARSEAQITAGCCPAELL